MNECTRGTCDVGEQLNNGEAYFLKCANEQCKHEEELQHLQKHSEMCPKYKKAILVWTPKTQRTVKT